jgi:hypothetical protein
MRMRVLVTLAMTLLFVAGTTGQPPGPDKKGWISLFNGKDLNGWHLRNGQGPNGWKVVDGVYLNTPPSTDIQTDAEFYDFQLHVEFNVHESKGSGNSGVYLRDKYEIQIFDSYGQPPSDHGCGALYRRTAPSVNASKPTGQWQTYDVVFIGRRLTVLHNDKKILDVADVGPNGTGAASNRTDGPGPLRLQGDHEVISYRNLRIRPLSKDEAEKLLKKL